MFKDTLRKTTRKNWIAWVYIYLLVLDYINAMSSLNKIKELHKRKIDTCVPGDYSTVVINPAGPLSFLCPYIVDKLGFIHNMRLYSPEMDMCYSKHIPYRKEPEPPCIVHRRSHYSDRMFLDVSKETKYYYALLAAMFGIKEDQLFPGLSLNSFFSSFLSQKHVAPHKYKILALLFLLSEGVNMPLVDTFNIHNTKNGLLTYSIRLKKMNSDEFHFNVKIEACAFFEEKSRSLIFSKGYHKSQVVCAHIVAYVFNAFSKYSYLRTAARSEELKNRKETESSLFLRSLKWLIQLYIFKYLNSLGDLCIFNQTVCELLCEHIKYRREYNVDDIESSVTKVFKKCFVPEKYFGHSFYYINIMKRVKSIMYGYEVFSYLDYVSNEKRVLQVPYYIGGTRGSLYGNYDFNKQPYLCTESRVIPFIFKKDIFETPIKNSPNTINKDTCIKMKLGVEVPSTNFSETFNILLEYINKLNSMQKRVIEYKSDKKLLQIIEQMETFFNKTSKGPPCCISHIRNNTTVCYDILEKYIKGIIKKSKKKQKQKKVKNILIEYVNTYESNMCGFVYYKYTQHLMKECTLVVITEKYMRLIPITMQDEGLSYKKIQDLSALKNALDIDENTIACMIQRYISKILQLNSINLNKNLNLESVLRILGCNGNYNVELIFIYGKIIDLEYRKGLIDIIYNNYINKSRVKTKSVYMERFIVSIYSSIERHLKSTSTHFKSDFHEYIYKLNIESHKISGSVGYYRSKKRLKYINSYDR
ncbi:hypothetical protein NEAUS03_0018 [Nematocida ausubeli]|nr:hypothetical protein NEAUS03_0018 [Nematocida ausubeli]